MARIGIDARFSDGQQGGVQQFVVGLAQGLSRMDAGDEYIFFAYEDQTEWLRPYLNGPCRLHTLEPAPRVPWYKRPFRQAQRLRRLWHAWQRQRGITLPRSDGRMEAVGIDLMHFTSQRAALMTLPTIYHPWDLQHIHLPHFFTAYERDHRDQTYYAFCQQAAMVAAASTWIKDDLLAHYELPDERVQVIPMASVLVDYPQLSAEEQAAMRARLPQHFAYYPAQTWPHKNHLRLLDALALLRDEAGLELPLVLSGTVNAHGRAIRHHIRRLGLENQVMMLGYVSQAEVHRLYQLAELLVFPSLFEGWGLPITEALSVGLPIACARTTHLPELVADAGLIFDPLDVADIAQTLYRLWTDEPLLHYLGQRAQARASRFTWDATAQRFSAHYHRLLGQTLSPQEQALLDAPPLV